jgi:hypothetical protein
MGGCGQVHVVGLAAGCTAPVKLASIPGSYTLFMISPVALHHGVFLAEDLVGRVVAVSRKWLSTWYSVCHITGFEVEGGWAITGFRFYFLLTGTGDQ